MCLISIKGLRLSIIIGTKSQERKKKQVVELDLCFQYDSSKAQKNDQLTHAVDYEALSREIITKTQETSFFLLERLGDFILNLVLRSDRRITRALIKITKFSAISKTKSVCIELEKSQRLIKKLKR